jgi:hypothetical protein
VSNDSIEIAAPPRPVPLTDPHELKGRMLEDYTRKAGTFGLPRESVEIEKLVLHDLELAAAFRRDEGPAPAPKAPDPEAAARRRRAAEQAAATAARSRTGSEIQYTAPREWGPVLDLPPDVENSDQWSHAKGRLRRISTGSSLPIKHPDGSYDFRSMTATCEYPEGAYEFLNNWFSLDFRYVWETRKHNPFYGLTHREASLKFVRLAMNICDRSSGVLGGWWIK